MKRLRLITVSENADRITRKLMWLSCAEIENSVPDAEYGLMRCDSSDERSDAEHSAQLIESALKFLRPYNEKKRGLFAQKKTVERALFDEPGDDYDRALEIADEAMTLFSQSSAIAAGKNNRKIQIKTLEPWKNAGLPLEIYSTISARLTYGTFPPGTDVASFTAEAETAENAAENAVPRTPPYAAEVVNADSEAVYALVEYCASDENDVLSLLMKHGFNKIQLSGYSGTAEENIERLNVELSELDKKKERLDERAKALAADIELLETAYDIAKTRAAAALAKQKMLCSERAVFLSAWVPVQAEKKLTDVLSKCECCFELSDPEEKDEDVPVLLSNNTVAEPFESVVSLYSLPAYKTFDPTFIMAIWYFIIFGFMLGDFVYGLILTVGGFLAIKLLHLEGGLKKLVSVFAICGISCMAVGVLFGSYFGDMIKVVGQNMFGADIPALAVWFDPVENPMIFLIVSLAIGVLHMLTGMLIQFYILCKDKKPFAAVFDVGSWIVLFAGIGLIFVNSTVGAAVTVLGAGMLIFTQGRHEKNIFMKVIKGVGSLYNIVSYISDLLSYSRIMALGLASAIIASVVNILSTLVGRSVVGFIAMLIIIPLGHIINLAINLLGTFVHTSRLQYIEFFGKFFVDGGRPFDPLKPEVKFTRVGGENDAADSEAADTSADTVAADAIAAQK